MFPRSHKKRKGLKNRDNVIRTYLRDRNWDSDKNEGDYPEFELKRKVIALQYEIAFYNGLLANYPYICDYEFFLKAGIKEQKGDLLFTDGNNNFLVVECKSLKFKTSNDKRRKSRRDLEDQVPTMMKILKISLKNSSSILGIGITDERDPYYIHCSFKFKSDIYAKIELPSLTVIEKNPVHALKDFCKENKLPEPEYNIIEKKVQLKVIFNSQEHFGESENNIYFSNIGKFYAAANLCKKLKIPFDPEFGTYI